MTEEYRKEARRIVGIVTKLAAEEEAERKEAYQLLEECRNWLAWDALVTTRPSQGHTRPYSLRPLPLFGKAGTRGL